MAAVFNTEEGKQYLPVKSNTEENETINGAVEVGIRSIEFATDGHDWKNIGCYKNKRGTWIIYGTWFYFVITIILLGLVPIFSILFSMKSEERCPDLLPAVLADPCPGDWVGYKRKCYYFSLTEGNWTVGSRHCSSHNASLAVVDSQEEKDFLLRYKSPPNHWIGLQKDSGQPWRWINGSIFTGEFFRLLMEEGRRCAYLDYNVVGSSSCGMALYWICSKEMTNTSQQRIHPGRKQPGFEAARTFNANQGGQLQHSLSSSRQEFFLPP
ncbi:C-type lectin domain family 2 member D-like [Anolis sagrei]|uniref:C-type lectin domain family 2 member D-like n=1 Tax=Anolis sagrei TaxID=38937 RepID=UPI003521BB67